MKPKSKQEILEAFSEIWGEAPNGSLKHQKGRVMYKFLSSALDEYEEALLKWVDETVIGKMEDCECQTCKAWNYLKAEMRKRLAEGGK